MLLGERAIGTLKRIYQGQNKGGTNKNITLVHRLDVEDEKKIEMAYKFSIEDLCKTPRKKFTGMPVMANNKSSLFLLRQEGKTHFISTTAVISLHGEIRKKYIFDFTDIASLLLELRLFIQYNGKQLKVDPYIRSPLFRIVSAYKNFQRKRQTLKVIFLLFNTKMFTILKFFSYCKMFFHYLFK
jgi:hypothetical protein